MSAMIRHDVLRRVDQWFGVPVCALLTGARWVSRVLFPKDLKQPAQWRRVLFIQLAESGSMVLADPAMRALATRTGAQLYCLTFAANRASLSMTGTIPDVQVYSIRTDSLVDLLADAWRFLLWVHRTGIDAVVDLELFSRLTAALCFFTGIPHRVGFHRFNDAGLYRGNLYSQPVAFNMHLHMAENYLQLVEALLGATQPPAPRLPSAAMLPKLHSRVIVADEIAIVRKRLQEVMPSARFDGQRLVLVNANASRLLPQRRWPEHHFVELIQGLLAQFSNVRVLLIGAAEDRECTSTIAGRVGDDRCVDVAGCFMMEQLPALFSLGSVMISNDSGPAHFAAVTALPVIVLFGPETPALFRPLGHTIVLSARLACSPCVSVSNQRKTTCGDNQCMKRISVAEVFEAACEILEWPLESDALQRQMALREVLEA